MEPGLGSLFESINDLEFANMMKQMRMDKLGRLFHVNFLDVNTLKKDILNAQLSYRLTKVRTKDRIREIVGHLTTELNIS